MQLTLRCGSVPATTTTTTEAAATPTRTTGANGDRSPRAEAHRETRTVRRYLEMLCSPQQRRRRTPEQVRERIDEISDAIDTETSPLRRLHLTQERIELTAHLDDDIADDTAEITAAFIDVAAAFSERRGITWAAWRELGVPVDVLRAAGVPETRTRS